MKLVDQVGLASVIATLIFRVVPLIRIVKVVKTGETRHIPFLIYFTSLISTTFFSMYGYKSRNWEICVINGSAVVILPIYLSLYIYNLPSMINKLLRFFLLILLFAITISTIVISFYLSTDLNGKIAVCLSFAVQSSQLYSIFRSFITKTRSTSIFTLFMHLGLQMF